MNANKGIVEWMQALENRMLYWVIEQIVMRRGVEFVYWVAPDKWEQYMQEEKAQGA